MPKHAPDAAPVRPRACPGPDLAHTEPSVLMQVEVDNGSGSFLICRCTYCGWEATRRVQDRYGDFYAG